MPKVDIYSEETQSEEHYIRFIMIECKHVVGILNRVASLMRRKRYNMEEVSVSFDSKGRARIIVAIDGKVHDIHHIMAQLKKLYDVYDAYDATYEYENIYHVVCVKAKTQVDFANYPFPPDRYLKIKNGIKGVFLVSLEQMPKLLSTLEELKHPYARRLVGINLD